MAWLLSQAIFCYVKVSCNTGWWIIRRLTLNTPSVVGFLSQRRCRAKVNSLKYNVIRDAFNCSIYSYSSWQQTYIGRKHANKTTKRKYTTTNLKTKCSLREAESFNYSNISSKDLDFIHRNSIIAHVHPKKWRVPLAALKTSHSMAFPHFCFSLFLISKAYCLKLCLRDLHNNTKLTPSTTHPVWILKKCTSSSQHNNCSYGYATHYRLIHFSSRPLSDSLRLKSSSWKPVRILCSPNHSG